MSPTCLSSISSFCLSCCSCIICRENFSCLDKGTAPANWTLSSCREKKTGIYLQIINKFQRLTCNSETGNWVKNILTYQFLTWKLQRDNFFPNIENLTCLLSLPLSYSPLSLSLPFFLLWFSTLFIGIRSLSLSAIPTDPPFLLPVGSSWSGWFLPCVIWSCPVLYEVGNIVLCYL